MVNRTIRTVLVVDDNPVQRYATVRSLASAGFRTREAVNGAEALERASAADVIVIDVYLPDMDGRDLCRRLRASSTTATVPIIHVSSLFVTDSDRTECARAGSDAFMVAPVPPGVLANTIDALIAARTSAGPVPPPGT